VCCSRCSGSDVTDALISILLTLMTPVSHRVAHDVAYGEGQRRTLDVYAPSKVPPGAPVVVFFYGGSWDSGDKALYRFVGSILAGQGMVAVIPDYRLFPEARWPAFVEDGARAVAWARDHAADYGADPSNLVLIGHSAGAYNAAALTYDARWLRAVGMDPARDVRAFVGLSGPYDFLPLKSDRLKTIFGPEAERPDTQPINHVDGDEPPALLLTGDNDKVVDPGNAARLAARIVGKGGTAETRTYAGLGHADTLSSWLPFLRSRAPVLRDVLGFVRLQTQPRAAMRNAA